MSTIGKCALAGMFTFALALGAQAAETVIFTYENGSVARPIVVPNSGARVTTDSHTPSTRITGYNGTNINPGISPYRADGSVKTGREISEEQYMLESYVYNG